MIMDILEKSKQYAQGKALEAMTSAIEKAYADGYNAGYADGISSKSANTILIDGVEYVDLNLPSGTLWASDYLKDSNNDYCYMIYDEAVKWNIPTISQYKELIDKCSSIDIHSPLGVILGKQYIGTNGKYLNIKRDKSIVGNNLTTNSKISYWLKNDKDANTDYKTIAGESSASREFKGYGLPVMLVKQK
jgi:hypothetical protein